MIGLFKMLWNVIFFTRFQISNWTLPSDWALNTVASATSATSRQVTSNHISAILPSSESCLMSFPVSIGNIWWIKHFLWRVVVWSVLIFNGFCAPRLRSQHLKNALGNKHKTNMQNCNQSMWIRQEEADLWKKVQFWISIYSK